MRNEVSGMMTTQGMQVSADFAAYLDQLVQTGDAGFRLMDGMVVALGRGVNPSPPETRPQPQRKLPMTPRLPLHLLMQRPKSPDRQQQTRRKQKLSWPKRLRLLQHSEQNKLQLRQRSTLTP